MKNSHSLDRGLLSSHRARQLPEAWALLDGWSGTEVVCLGEKMPEGLLGNGHFWEEEELILYVILGLIKKKKGERLEYFVRPFGTACVHGSGVCGL